MIVGFRRWLSICVGLMIAMPGIQAHAQKSPLDDRLTKVLASPSDTERAIGNAKKITFFCANCHGDDGNSPQNDVPNLAGQNPHYLLTQIDKFARGQRQYQFMEGLMKMLTEEDRINVTLFYTNKDVKPAGKSTSSAGATIYVQRCIMCHGQDAHGAETVPRLAGQQIRYLNLSITRYRDKSGERIYAPMSAITAGLKDAEIRDLTTYLSSLK